jgi:hypothetical protein
LSEVSETIIWMNSAAAQPAPRPSVQRFKQQILHGYCVRFHMGLILAAVIASGVLTSKLFLELGLHSLRLRYPIAVLGSYAVFLLLVRIWIWYVSIRHTASLAVGNFELGNFSGSGSGGGGTSVHFGGGDSGGGGASDLWDASAGNTPAIPAPSHSGGFSLPDLDLDLDDDGWFVLVLLLALVLCIFCAGGYLVYNAPQILPEAACQAVLATALTRLSKVPHYGWMPGILRSTAIPFALVLIFAGALGWAAHRHCPGAARLIDVLRCPAR